MKAQKVKLKNFNIEKFLSVFKNISKISKENVIITVDRERFHIQSSNFSKTCFKFLDIPTADLVDNPENLSEETVILPFSTGDSITKALGLYTPTKENELVIEYGQTEDGLIAEKMTLNEENGELKIDFVCTFFGTLIFVDRETISKLSDVSNSIGVFQVEEQAITKILNLFILDDVKSEFVKFKNENEKMYINGLNYVYEIANDWNGKEDIEIEIKKSFLNFIEKNYSLFSIFENRVMVKNNAQQTTTIFSLAD